MRSILRVLFGLRVLFWNAVKPHTWWVNVDEPPPRAVVGNEVKVRGWAFNPLAEIVRIDVYIEGRRYAQLKTGQARPDVMGRFRMPNARYSGFSGSFVYETTIDRQIECLLRITDDVGEITEAVVPITVHASMPDASPESDQHLVPDDSPEGAVLDAILSEYSLRFSGQPIIIDWESGLDPMQRRPGLCTIVRRDSDLPDFSASVDLVLVGQGHLRHIDMAVRVARRGVVGVVAARGDDTAEYKVQWQGEVDDPMSERVSLIIYGLQDTELMRAMLKVIPDEPIIEIVVLHPMGVSLHDLIAGDPRIKEIILAPEINRAVALTRAGQSAQGDILVFLHGDALPRPGWLGPLVAALRDQPRAGIVLAKALAADGRLHEAGGVLLRDGDLYRFGHSDTRPMLPLYTHTRPVHGGSLGAFAMRRDYFVLLAGFDARFNPAGCGLMDVCLRARQHSDQPREVVYQPESVVQFSRSVPVVPDAEQMLFREVWRETARTAPPVPSKYDYRDLAGLLAIVPGQVRVLVAVGDLLAKVVSQRARRVMQLIALVQEQGAYVSVLSTVIDGTWSRRLRQSGAIVFTTSDADPLPDLLGVVSYAAVVAFGWQVPHDQVLPHMTDTPRLMLDLDTLPFAERVRSEAGLLDVAGSADMVHELNIYGIAAAIALRTTAQAALLSALLPAGTPVGQVPLVDALPVSQYTFSQREGMLIYADLTDPINAAVVRYLGQEVLPQVDPALLAAHPVYLLGSGADALRGAFGDGVLLRVIDGSVDLLPYLHQARVAVVGAFTPDALHGLLLSAMMVGTPCVVDANAPLTSVNVQHEQHALIAESAWHFAQGLSHLLRDEALWIRIAAHAYEYALGTHHLDMWRDAYLRLMLGTAPAPR